jgi:hypothetical protein
MTKSENCLVKGATVSPGDYPLGSGRSRAAARALAEQQAKADLESRHKIVITTNVPMADADETFLDERGETMYRKTVYGSRIER